MLVSINSIFLLIFFARHNEAAAAMSRFGVFMKATSHFAMAHLLFAALQNRGIYLNRVAFVYGNIAPDYKPSMWVSPHFGKVCSRASSEILTELSELPVSVSGRVGAEYSRQLGYMCHFICDYFCFAHNEDFYGGLKQHAAYENELDAYFRGNCLKLLDVHGTEQIHTLSTADEIINNAEDVKAEYLEIGHSLKNDLCFAFSLCVQSIASIVAISKKVPAAAINIELDNGRTELKGYATGDNLIFRMFFYKYRNYNLFFLPEFIPPIGAY